MRHASHRTAPVVMGHVASLNPAAAATRIHVKARQFAQWVWIADDGCLMCGRRKPPVMEQLVGHYIAPRSKDVADDIEVALAEFAHAVVSERQASSVKPSA